LCSQPGVRQGGVRLVLGCLSSSGSSRVDYWYCGAATWRVAFLPAFSQAGRVIRQVCSPKGFRTGLRWHYCKSRPVPGSVQVSSQAGAMLEAIPQVIRSWSLLQECVFSGRIMGCSLDGPGQVAQIESDHGKQIKKEGRWMPQAQRVCSR
jgi:hypothetical protein